MWMYVFIHILKKNKEVNWIFSSNTKAIETVS